MSEERSASEGQGAPSGRLLGTKSRAEAAAAAAPAAADPPPADPSPAAAASPGARPSGRLLGSGAPTTASPAADAAAPAESPSAEPGEAPQPAAFGVRKSLEQGGFGVRNPHFEARDLFAEAQVRGLSLILYLIGGLLTLSGSLACFAALGTKGASQGRGMRGLPPELARDMEAMKLAAVVPILVWLVFFTIKLIATRKRGVIMILPTLVLGSAWLYTSAPLLAALGLSIFATGMLFFMLGQSLSAYGPFARWFAILYGFWLFYGPVSLLMDGAVLPALYGVIPAVAFLVTLFHPRVRKVFDGNYALFAEKDPRPVHRVHGIAMWVCLAWVVLPAAVLLPSFKDLVMR